ncbi:hypothetical protein CVIRNUC_003562 [Coccomyxa viridis]|uniref:Uncharacterized protein n=1 Tax=Coccomyxa viridis TaxID=1274662 RepID=A0AAV1I287_9CHLO|nr:hypothetical protein CVIRNUC_003562 [Coccomyxa viridis]
MALEVPHGDGGDVPQDGHGCCIDGTGPPVDQTQSPCPGTSFDEQWGTGVEPEM